MKYRKLRIAWSVAWAVVTVLLCLMWVRSYWIWDLIDNGVRPSRGGMSSVAGRIGGSIAADPAWRTSLSAYKWYATPRQPSQRGYRWLPSFERNKYRIGMGFPYWSLVVFSVTLASTPWLRWRFSLRTLLIATTLVAVLLGISVWLGR